MKVVLRLQRKKKMVVYTKAIKMKTKFFAALLMTALFASCGEEDCNHKGISPDNKGDENIVTVVGNWYQESENEEMRYNASGTFYDKYCNTTSHGETEGRWEWDEANKRLTTKQSVTKR